jgi:hypothetical protein
VGHSSGGAAITDPGTHDAVRHLVYVSASCLDAHRSVMENDLASGAGGDLEAGLRFGDDAVITVDPDVATTAFFDDCPEQRARAAVARLGPELASGFGQPPREVGRRERPNPFAVCTLDRGTAELPRSLAARCTTTVDRRTAHGPFLSRPDLTAGLLAELAREVA